MISKIEHELCIYSQLLLLNLLEKLEPKAEVINLKTDGIIYKSFGNDLQLNKYYKNGNKEPKCI